jgi:hypothetical protein
MPNSKSFVELRAATLLAIANTAKLQADLVRKHRWSEVDWEWLERKITTALEDQTVFWTE